MIYLLVWIWFWGNLIMFNFVWTLGIWTIGDLTKIWCHTTCESILCVRKFPSLPWMYTSIYIHGVSDFEHGNVNPYHYPSLCTCSWNLILKLVFSMKLNVIMLCMNFTDPFTHYACRAGMDLHKKFFASP